MNKSALRSRFTDFLASVNGDGGYGVGLLLTPLVLLATEMGGEAGRLALRYDRVRIAAGQWWRLGSAHLVHLDLRHALLNAAGAALMWALFARDFRPRQWLLILLFSMAVIDAAIWFLDPRLEWYVGSSGVLHAVMAAGSVAHLRRREREGVVLLLFLAVKLAWEQWHGALPFNASPERVVVDAHLYGALAGAALALGLRSRPERL